MAAGNKKDEKEKVDDAAAAAVAKAEAKQKRKKILIFIGLAILLVGLSVGATLLAMKLFGPKAAKNTETSESSSATDSSEASESAKASEAIEPTKPAIYVPLKPNFTVNFDVNGRQRFLQAELTLMYRDESIASILELHMPEVRNGLVMLLSNQIFDDLQTIDGKEKLRTAALKTVQDILTKEMSATPDKNKKDGDKEKSKDKNSKSPANIEQVLFTNFVMQ